jgi:tRNA(Arg) A34 adenosine deaminase TadA
VSSPAITDSKTTDHQLLNRAIELAAESPEKIGCGVVITQNGRIIAETTNSQRTDKVAVYHAEIKAILAANKATGERALANSTAYCSCEPCTMCLTALSYAKIERVVFDLRMIDVFPNDPPSKLDPYEFVKGLNFVPRLERLQISQP